MKYCSTCLQPDTRPGEQFDDSGNCLACRSARQGDDIDYEERFLVLRRILKEFPRAPGQLFDCVLGVSGGKDSTRQALWLRDRLELNALLVCLSWPPEQVNERGAHNLSSLIELGFDTVVSAPAPGTWRRLMRKSFLRFGNWAKSTELALYSSIPQIALRYGIRLIFNGEDPGQREVQALGDEGWDNNGVRNLNTLAGGSMDWLLNDGFSRDELLPYVYPAPQDFERYGLQIVDLGWFLGDWSFRSNGAYAAAVGFDPRTESPEETGDLSYVSAVDEDWVSVNQVVKYYKFGYGKVTDYVNEEIRSGRLRRNEGASLVESYDGKCTTQLIEKFCEYIEISTSQFWDVVRRFANPDLFEIRDGGILRPRFRVGL